MTNTQVARTQSASIAELLAHLAAEEKRWEGEDGDDDWKQERFEQIVTPATRC